MKITCHCYDVMKMALFFCTLSLPNPQSLIMRKAADKSKLRAFCKILGGFSLNHQNQENLKTATAKRSPKRHDK